MRGKQKRYSFLSVITVLLIAAGAVMGFPGTAHAGEIPGKTEENAVYDALKERMETAWERGMGQIEGAEPIEIAGDLPERLLRGIAAVLFRNLKSIRAGAVLVGVISLVLGGTVALLARKDKKIQKKAVGVCMAAVPGLLTVLVFGISWFVSIFR